MKKIIQHSLICCILLLIIMVNIRGLVQNYYGFYYYQEKNLLQENTVNRKLSFLEDNRPINLFLSYTGLETGYGFFAPNVASDFITSFHVYDKDGRLLDTSNFIRLQNKESFIRISSAYNIFLEYVKDDSTTLEFEKCNIFLKGLSRKMLQQTSNANSVRTELFLFHYPLLSQLQQQRNLQPSYILYLSRAYSIKDYANWK